MEVNKREDMASDMKNVVEAKKTQENGCGLITWPGVKSDKGYKCTKRIQVPSEGDQKVSFQKHPTATKMFSNHADATNQYAAFS